MTFQQFVSFNRSIDRHDHSPSQRLQLHHDACERSARYGPQGFQEVLDRVFARASDPSFLYTAWRRVCASSGTTAGPDGMTVDYFHFKSQVFEFLRCIRHAIRQGSYRHGETRPYEVPKASGTGTRTIEVPDLCDRVVQASVLTVLQPLLDPLFDPGSLGFRPGKGRFVALAEIERLIDLGASHVVTADVRDAFPSVPHARLLQVLASYLGRSPPLVELIAEIVRAGGRTRGLCQGGPLSPLLLNLYLHHFVDSRWPAACPRSPFLLRYADNVAVCCDRPDRAAQVKAALTCRFDGAGLNLTWPPAVPDLLAGGEVSWMGVDLGCAGDVVRMRVPDGSWARLERNLREEMTRPSPNFRAKVHERVVGWLGEIGPAYLHEDHAAAHARLASILDGMAFGRQLRRKPFEAHWRRAYLRWTKLRRLHRPEDEYL
jgi:hypothetical protein